MKICIRSATKSDGKDIIHLITELALFEKLSPPDKKAQQRLLKDAFSSKPPFKILLAEVEDKIVAYAFYFFTYSTFLARKTLYLEDIFVSKKYRKLGIGKLLFEKLMQIAKKEKCGRIEFIVLHWNKNAINFYRSFKAKIMKDWLFFRIELKT
ncbi:MAG: GNAT family N-acetyltransferase [Ignavibacteria bacterium]